MPQMNLLNATLTADRTITFPNASGTVALTGTPGTVWDVTGNAGTNPAVNFLGTTDAQDLVLRANNVERFRLLSAGGASIPDGTALRFYEPSGSGINYTSFQAQAQAADISYTLPATQGAASTALTNDGTGILSWQPSSAPVEPFVYFNMGIR